MDPIEFSHITTRGGDEGKTSLLNGSRRFKSESVFFVLGDIDELSSAIGLARAELTESGDRRLSTMTERLLLIQKELLLMGGHVATAPPEKPYCVIHETALAQMEQWQAEYMLGLQVEGFVYPGANKLTASLDLARTVARRAERQLVRFIGESHAIGQGPNQKYLNRLSDFLFVCARKIALLYGLNES